MRSHPVTFRREGGFAQLWRSAGGSFRSNSGCDDCLCRSLRSPPTRRVATPALRKPAKYQGQTVRTRGGKGDRDSMGAPATRSGPRVLVDDGRLTSCTSLEMPTSCRGSRSEARSGASCCCASGLIRREGRVTFSAFPSTYGDHRAGAGW